jgi:Fe-S cluster assembly protein SufB
LNKNNKILQKYYKYEYKYGFYNKIISDKFTKGLDVNIIYNLSKTKYEPYWLTKWRIESYKIWKHMQEPHWANIYLKKINYKNIIYYSSPKITKNLSNPYGLNKDLFDMFNKLGIPLSEQKKMYNISMDMVLDSKSIIVTFKEELYKKGIIFCSISEAITKYPNLVKKYIGSVVSRQDNFYSALNSAVFTDGSFCYIPKGVTCPMELSTYFRINEIGTGQFERTLIIADEDSNVSYLEGCTAPQRNENQLHAAVVEIIALKNSKVKYSTVQNWYPGDKNGIGGIYNFVTKRGICKTNANISWIQIEIGSSITCKYPSCILQGDYSKGEFNSVTLTKNLQQSDTGTKMIHIGKNTKSTIISKGIATGKSKNSYRGLVKICDSAINCQNFSKCDSLLIGNKCKSYTFPVINSNNSLSRIEHEASISKFEEKQIFYCNQRGLDTEEAVSLRIHGFSKDILNKLPLEFAIEAKNMLEISLEETIG